MVGSETFIIYANDLDEIIKRLENKGDGEWIMVDYPTRAILRKDAVDIICIDGL